MVGALIKQLWVYGDREWTASVLRRTTPPVPFVRMPITYERAYGGCDPRYPQSRLADNPVGLGHATSDARRVGLSAPNIVYDDDSPTRVAGLGPIDRTWQPRVRLAGTYDDAWQTTRLPLLPLDFDDEFYQCSPADQRPASALIRLRSTELLSGGG